jgi:hypothetical protein
VPGLGGVPGLARASDLRAPDRTRNATHGPEDPAAGAAGAA